MDTPFTITPEGLGDSRPFEHILEDRTRAAYRRLTDENPQPGSTRYYLLRADYLEARLTEFQYLTAISDPVCARDHQWAADHAARDLDAVMARLTSDWAEV